MPSASSERLASMPLTYGPRARAEPSVNGAPTVATNATGIRLHQQRPRRRPVPPTRGTVKCLQAAADQAASKHLGDTRNLGKAGPLGGPARRPHSRRHCDAQVWRNPGQRQPSDGVVVFPVRRAKQGAHRSESEADAALLRRDAGRRGRRGRRRRRRAGRRPPGRAAGETRVRPRPSEGHLHPSLYRYRRRRLVLASP